MQQRLFVAVVFACAVVALAGGETTCESHRSNSRGSVHGVGWNIECDSEGFYLPLQCTNDTEKSKWCACYDKEEAITRPNRKTRSCVCLLKRDEALNNSNAAECDVPQCDKTGRYESRQCCGEMCRCVHPETGEKRTEPERNPNLQC